jgi:hypothetical protein
VRKMLFDDVAERLAVERGSILAEGLGTLVRRRDLTPREKVLVWIGVLARLRTICNQQLGQTQTDDVFASIEVAARRERARDSSERRQRSRKSLRH